MKANMLSLHTPMTSGVRGQKVILFFFSKSGHVAYQIKVEEVQTYMQGFKGQILKLCRCKYIFIKLSTKTCLTGVCYDLNNTEGELRVR